MLEKPALEELPSIVVPTRAEAAATCVTSCATKPDGAPCTCYGADPCTASCVSNACSDGGGC